MPTASLWEKFIQVVSVSKVFKLMSESDQTLLLTGFQTSTDEQLTEAIKAIQEEDQNFNQVQQAQLAQAQDQIALSEQLHADLKNSEKQLLVSDEAQETASNAQTLQNIEAELNGGKTSDHAKSKKFLGLF